MPIQTIPLKPKTFNLEKADRPYSQEEIEAESKAEKLSIKAFKRINPIPGTLAFLFRNIDYKNDQVVAMLKVASEGNNSKMLKNVIIFYESLDENSQKRPDAFDIICKKFDYSIKKLWGAYQEGAFEFNDVLAKTALDGHKIPLIETLIIFSKKERNSADRKLLAEAVGLIKKEPLINQTVNNLNVNKGASAEIKESAPSFLASISKDLETKEIEGIEKETLQLESGEQNYIDAEYEMETIENAKRELSAIPKTDGREL